MPFSALPAALLAEGNAEAQRRARTCRSCTAIQDGCHWPTQGRVFLRQRPGAQKGCWRGGILSPANGFHPLAPASEKAQPPPARGALPRPLPGTVPLAGPQRVGGIITARCKWH